MGENVWTQIAADHDFTKTSRYQVPYIELKIEGFYVNYKNG